MEWVAAAERVLERQISDMKSSDLMGRHQWPGYHIQQNKEALTANPNIMKIPGAPQCLMLQGAALAVEEWECQEKIKIVGTALVSNAGEYVKNGTIDMISFWGSGAVAGKAMVETAVKLLKR